MTGGRVTPITEFVMCSRHEQLPHVIGVDAACSDDAAMTSTTMSAQQAKALYANSADTAEELSFSAGDLLTVHERDVAGLAGWWLCSYAGRLGIAPGNRLRLLPAPAEVCGSRHRGVQTDDCDGSPTSTTKPRPATAPQRAGHAALNAGTSTATSAVSVDIFRVA